MVQSIQDRIELLVAEIEDALGIEAPKGER